MPEDDRKPGSSPRVGDVRGMVLRKHLRELVAVQQAQVPPLEGLSFLRNPSDPEPTEIKIDSILVIADAPTSALRDDRVDDQNPALRDDSRHPG
ncbi:hypothetical protein [Myxococcus sp. SDU36]|uniref:hypothetical protein n=1 Tax=Myxococcus sp. SDU36 TaxID=2831967 RepID=UPI002543535C|nr:hypothetical protein [Myxococcus sp. SDU36]WIG93660.1 hypothetical protein KGD87_24145 [Myxococcus sp. SDU36]